MNGVKGSSPWRRVACAIACLAVLLVVVDSLRASGPQPTANRISSAQALYQPVPHQQPFRPSIARFRSRTRSSSLHAAAAAVSPHRGGRQSVLRHLPQREIEDGRPCPRDGRRRHASAPQRRGVGESGAQASGARDASPRDASPRRGCLPEFRLAPGDVARSVRRGQPESRTSRHAPPAQSHRISERRPRPARSRGGCRGHSAERRLELWLRQHQRRRAVADAARALPRRLAEDQPSGGRHTGSIAPARRRWFCRRI